MQIGSPCDTLWKQKLDLEERQIERVLTLLNIGVGLLRTLWKPKNKQFTEQINLEFSFKVHLSKTPIIIFFMYYTKTQVSGEVYSAGKSRKKEKKRTTSCKVIDSTTLVMNVFRGAIGIQSTLGHENIFLIFQPCAYELTHCYKLFIFSISTM